MYSIKGDKADEEWKGSLAKAPGQHCLACMYGIPVLLKDNFSTKDKINTTAGVFGLLGAVAHDRLIFHLGHQVILNGLSILGFKMWVNLNTKKRPLERAARFKCRQFFSSFNLLQETNLLFFIFLLLE